MAIFIEHFSILTAMISSCTQTLLIKKYSFKKQSVRWIKLLSKCQKLVPQYGNEHLALPYFGRHSHISPYWTGLSHR